MIRRRKHSDDIEDPLVPSGRNNSLFTSRCSMILLKLAVLLPIVVLGLVLLTRRGVDVADAGPQVLAVQKAPFIYSLPDVESALPAPILASFHRYRALHARALGDLGGGGTTRYIVAHPSGQLCNRIRLIVSALVLGLLTDRVVLVEFRTGYYASMEDLFDSPIVMEMESAPPRIKTDVRALASLRTSGICGADQLLCQDPTAWTARTVLLSGACYSARIMWQNPHLRPLFRERIGEFEGSFGRVFDFFLAPSKPVAQNLKAFLQNEFNGHYMVSFHIRGGGDFTDRMSDEDLENFVKCSRFVVPKEIQEHDMNTKAGDRLLKFFIAADSAETRERFGAFLHVNSTSFGNFAISDTPSGCQAAFTELLLLRSAKARLLTPWSSFSEVAGTNGHENVYSVQVSQAAKGFPYSDGESVAEDAPRCLRTRSVEPSVSEIVQVVEGARCDLATDVEHEKK